MKNSLIAFLSILFFLVIICFFHISDILKIEKIIDGDTIYFQKDIKCRLAYIDAPESYENEKFFRDYAQCSLRKNDLLKAGKDTTSYLNSILKIGNKLKIKIVDTDIHNRKVCELYTLDNFSISELLVQEGFALPFYKFINSKNKSKYDKILNKAIKENKGNWKKHNKTMNCLLKIRRTKIF